MLANAQNAGLGPEQFWRLSMREWRALHAGVTAEAMTRAAFEALSQFFPDKR
jgi:uncharacterized phage protein (TIGR02216 family)